ncbi:hypothetical protein [Planctobacterium marinum]|uniref:hypothetical protein n=1 Tax=Planctobacterium marinum TaxID=1631968 RepID=UPI001E5DDFF0|nr:hypothetical protein [Planctobacterium marinum]MCC2606618.1 hypothetical protein [Planctobacterium marinum]
MKELNEFELEVVSAGNLGAAIGIGLGFVGAFDSLTSFGSALGAGIYDGIHNRRN